MVESVNAVINNVCDRFGEIMTALGPAVEKVGAISNTVVQETSMSGFVYVMLGLSTLGVAGLAVFGIILAMRHMDASNVREATVGWLIAATVIFTGTGFAIALSNIVNRAAPTRQVIREIVEHF